MFMKKSHILQIVTLVLILIAVFFFQSFKSSSPSLNEEIAKEETGVVKTGSSVVVTSGGKTVTGGVVAVNKEFPFNLNEKSLVAGTPFGSFKYSGYDYANYHKFSGSATVSGEVILVKSDGTHNLGLKVDKSEVYKLPQYYFVSIKGEDADSNYERADNPYDLCFGYYYPQQYDYNQLLDKLAAKPGEKVTVKIDNYKIIASSKHTGACANLLEIVE